jgi:hypothetical protein
MKLQSAHSADTVGIRARHFLTTDELAERLSVRARSIHKRYSQTGAYFSVRPVKLPNGRLWWPIDSVEQLAGVAA